MLSKRGAAIRERLGMVTALLPIVIASGGCAASSGASDANSHGGAAHQLVQLTPATESSESAGVDPRCLSQMRAVRAERFQSIDGAVHAAQRLVPYRAKLELVAHDREHLLYLASGVRQATMIEIGHTEGGGYSILGRSIC